jgi:predicted dehydrogenase
MTMSESTRREFLKHTSTAALSAGVLGSINARAYAAGDETIRVGLIGCGGRGNGAAKQALSTQGNVRLVAMGDAFEDALERSHRDLQAAFQDKPDRIAVGDNKFAGFDAYQKVLDSGVDLVILATPPGFRSIHFEAAVKAGKNIFAEKPVATDAPGVRRFLAANEQAKQKNLKVGVGLQRHHQNCYLDLVQQIHDGVIGEIVALRVYWNGGGVWEPRKTREQCRSEMEYQVANWYYYNWLCGDHIVEQHIHNIDVGCWIKQAFPVKARGMGGRQVRTDKRYGEIYDHHAVEYFFEDGSVMFSQCRHIPNCWNAVSEFAHGTEGMAALDSNSRAGDNYIQPKRGERYAYRARGNDPYQTEHDDLFAAIREDRSYNEGDNGARSTMAAILGRMCTYSGREISWDEALKSERSLMPKEFAWDAEPPVQPNAEGEYPIAVPGVTQVV